MAVDVMGDVLAHGEGGGKQRWRTKQNSATLAVPWVRELSSVSIDILCYDKLHRNSLRRYLDVKGESYIGVGGTETK